MKKRILALLLALAMVLGLLTGCGADAPAAGEDTADAEDSAAGDDAGTGEEEVVQEVPAEAREDVVSYITNGALTTGDIVMTVNGIDIPAESYLYWLAYQYTYAAYTYASYGYSLDLTETIDEEGTTVADSFQQQAAVILQMNTLLRGKAQEAGVSLTEQQLTDQATMEDNYDDNTLLFYATTMEALNQAYIDSCLASNLKEQLFSEEGEMAPTSETLADYAEEHGTYTCRYILLSTSDLEEDDQDGRDAQLALAQELYEQLQACSAEELEETFAQLQTEHNYDGNTEPYTFDNDDSLVSGFREKVAELAVGELGLTDETDYGYFVLLRLENDAESLEDDYASATYNSLISQWMDEAQVETSEVLDGLDAAACFDRLTTLQDALSAELSAQAEAEESTETADEDSAESEDASGEEPVG